LILGAFNVFVIKLESYYGRVSIMIRFRIFLLANQVLASLPKYVNKNYAQYPV